MLLHFALKADVITLPYKRDPSSISAGMNYLHTSKGRGVTSPEQLTSRGNRISTDGDGRLCTDDSPAAAIIPACASLQQVALTVSPAEATTSTVGSLTSGGDHLSTGDSGHLRASTVQANDGRANAHKEVFAPVLTTGVRTRPSKNAAQTRTAYDVLYDLPSAAGAAREAVDVANPCMARPSLVRWTGNHAPPQQ
jgi:hypothetical protein